MSELPKARWRIPYTAEIKTTGRIEAAGLEVDGAGEHAAT